MQVTYSSGDAAATAADALVVPVLSTEDGLEQTGPITAVIGALGDEVLALAEGARFTGKTGSTLRIPTFGKLPQRWVVLTGLGSGEKVTAESVRRAYGAAITVARDSGAANVVAALPGAGVMDAGEAAEAAREGSELALYRFARYYGTARADDPAPREIGSLTFVGEGDAAAIQRGLTRGAARAAGVALARDLSNEPASVLNPVTMEAECRRVAEEQGLEITVLGPTEMEAHGMGAILAVGKGSAVEPRMVHLVYRPKEQREGSRTVGIVGKCITFDTGGYSIKPYEGMLEMKGDMAGGAAVLGAMRALRDLDCPHTVHAVICAAENMISGEAFRPGDILTAMNGVTIEVLSTDAEGRLVLADGLVYCSKQGVEEMIDLATLTGAIVVALGDDTAGLFSSDDALAERLLVASKEAGERMWRMPLIEEYESKIKGEVGDIKNTGGRAGGAISAALFIQHFREGLPWAHLDIAGSARATKSSPYTPKGATGVGVRTLLEYVKG